MKKSVVLVFALLLMVAIGLQASPNTSQSKPGPSSHLTRNDFVGKPLPAELQRLLKTNDPAGDGFSGLAAGCSADDCRVCNYNGLMCTPTKDGCSCDFWPF
jgi:hypothetical protein